MKSKVILFSVLLFCSKFVDAIDRQRAYPPSNRPVSQNIPNRQYHDTDFAQTRDGKTNSALQQENAQDYYANQGIYNYDSYGYNKGPVSSHSGKKLLVSFDSTADGRRLDPYPSRVESNPSRTFQVGLDNQQYGTKNWRSQNQYANSAPGAVVIHDNERPLVTSVQEPYRGPDQYPQLKFVQSSNRRYYQTDKTLPTREQYQYPSADNSGNTKYIANSASRSGSSSFVPKENYSEDEVIASETKARPTGGLRHVESFAPQSNNVKHVENYRSHSDLRNTAPITNYNDGYVANYESDFRPGNSAPVNTYSEAPPAPDRYLSQYKSSNRSSEDTYSGQDLYQQIISGIKTYNLKSIVSNPKIKDLLTAPNRKRYRYVVVHPNGTVQYLNQLDIGSNINSKYHLIHRKRVTFDEAGDNTEGIYPTQSQAYTPNNIAAAPIPDTLPLNLNQPTDDNNSNPLPPYYDNQPADDNNPKPLPPSENKPTDGDNSKQLPSFVNQSADDNKPLPPYDIQRVDDTQPKPLPPYVDQPEDDNKSKPLPLYENKPADYNNLRPLPENVNQPENKPANDDNSKPLPSFVNHPEDDNKPETLSPYEIQQVDDTQPKPLPPYVDQPEDDNKSESLPPYKNQPDDKEPKPLPPSENKPADGDNSKQLPSFVNQSADDNKPLPPYNIQRVDDTQPKPLPPYVDQPEDDNKSKPLPLYENKPADYNNLRPLPENVNQPENKPANDDNSKPLPSFINHPEDDNKPETLSPYEIQQVDDTQPKPLPPYVDQPEDDNKSESLPPYKNQPDDKEPKPLPPSENKPADGDNSKQLLSFVNQSAYDNKPLPPYDIQRVDDTQPKPLPPYVDQPEDDNKSKSLPPYGTEPTGDSKSKPTTTTNNLDDDQFTSTTSSVIVSDYNTSSTPRVPNEPQDKEKDQLSTTDSPAVVTTSNPKNTSADEIITISPIELATDNVSDVPPVTTTTTSPAETYGELDSIKYVYNKDKNTPADTTSSSPDLEYSTTTVFTSSSASATDNINEDKIIKEIIKNKNYTQTEGETVVKQMEIGKNDTQTGDTSTPGHDSLEVEKSGTNIPDSSNTTANNFDDGAITISIEVSDSTDEADDADDKDSSSDEEKIMVNIDTKNSSEDDSKTPKTDDCKKVQNDDNRDMANMTEEPTMWIRTNNQGFIDKLMAKNETELDLLYLFFIENQPIIEREKETTIFCNGTVVIEVKETKYACEDDLAPIIEKTTKIMRIEDYESEKSNLGSKN